VLFNAHPHGSDVSTGCLMIYWITGTIETALLPYWDFVNSGAMTWCTTSAPSFVPFAVPS
jgi:hypothetical protein